MAKQTAPDAQRPLPGVTVPGAAGASIEFRGRRIPQLEILKTLSRSGTGRGVVEIYKQEVLPIKTRTLRLVGRKCSARVIHTLLGYEVKASFKRIQCPDMVTARYVKLFTELGCRSIKLPYDPTVTARLIPELERAVESLLRGVSEMFDERTVAMYVARYLFALIRAELR